MSFQTDGSNNYDIFRECVSAAIVQKSQGERERPGKRKKGTGKKRANASYVTTGNTERQDPEELAEFIDFIASETFSALPIHLQTLTYSQTQTDTSLAAELKLKQDEYDFFETLAAPIPVSVRESLAVYGLLPDSLDLVASFLRPVLTEYIASATTGPPVWISTRTEACEICERDWIPLSYHHLIPREVHAKVLKRGWHEEWMLNSVAWLCRACHSFVHRMASNEQLAREYYTVARILERDDVQDWARWVGRVRWKAR